MTIEAKYTYPTGMSEILHSGLTAVCIRDAEHPADTINSIYFDTVDRFHLAEKVNSDYLKSKVRLRWYSPTDDSDADTMVPAFLEVKGKQGCVRRKERIAIDVPLRSLERGNERFEDLVDISRHARECGYTDVGHLFPMITIRYRRQRSYEPVTNSRISLDSHITYTGVNSQFFAATAPRTLSIGVLEVKNATGGLPKTLVAIRNFLNKRDAFSKYEECWQLYSDPLYRREFQWMHFRK